MKWVILLLLLGISFISAQCDNGQININTASLSDLDKLTGIGPAYAQRIMDSRSFSSLDDLTRVKGIGDITLQKIKTQGLACVDPEAIKTSKKEDTTGEDNQELEQNSELEEQDIAIEISSTINANVIFEPKTESIINLNHKKESISEKIIYESKNEKIRKYSIYAFAFFLLVVILFLLLDKNGRTEDYGDNDC